MPVKLEQHRFKIENTEVERFSFELIEYFMREEAYTMFNIEEKILENFNHADYQIIYIYSEPIINNAHLDILFEKINVMKHQLRRSFFSFRPKILVVATNADMNLDDVETPNNVQMVKVSNVNDLQNHSLFKECYPTIVNRPFNNSLPQITLNINRLSFQHAADLHAIFNKRSFMVTLLTITLVVSMLLIGQFNPHAYSQIRSLLILDANRFAPYALITNSLLYISAFSTIFDIFIMVQLGLLIERMYGSLRFFTILIVSAILSNTLLFAFRPEAAFTLGFTPIIYGLFGAFVYAFLVFRRLLAYPFRRMLMFLIFVLFLLVTLFDPSYLMAVIGAFIGGLITSFVVGIPHARNSTFKNRFTSGVLLAVLVIIGLFIGLKGV